MAIELKINEYTYTLPTTWQEVTVGQFIALNDYANELSAARLLSIFTGMDYDVLLNLPIEHFNVVVLPEMGFIGEKFDPFKEPRKKTIHIGQYDFEAIIDPGRERLGQKLFLQQLVNNAITNNVQHYNLICPVVACYYAPFVHPEKKWDEKHVYQFAKLVENTPISEAYPEANFFLSGYMRYFPKKATS
jgi:hypothetical protein